MVPKPSLQNNEYPPTTLFTPLHFEKKSIFSSSMCEMLNLNHLIIYRACFSVDISQLSIHTTYRNMICRRVFQIEKKQMNLKCIKYVCTYIFQNFHYLWFHGYTFGHLADHNSKSNRHGMSYRINQSTLSRCRILAVKLGA